MATKKYDIAVKTGTYTGNDGTPRARYQNVGALMENDDGQPFLVLVRWFNPSGVEHAPGKDAIILSLFEPREFEDRPRASSPSKAADVAKRVADAHDRVKRNGYAKDENGVELF